MKLKFLGTRGYIDARTPLHRLHTALLVTHHNGRVMIDCGEDWTARVARLRPQAILVTHAHPDHAGGLRDGSPCPVHATRDGWRGMARFAIASQDRHVLDCRRTYKISGIGFEAFPVVHSILAPAVGYRISVGGVRVFYVPEVLAILQRAEVLAGVCLYVGDGASIVRPIVRRRGRRPFGHAPVRAQLGWCHSERVARAVFTHCGSQIVAGDERGAEARIRHLGRERDIDARIAPRRDGARARPGGRRRLTRARRA
jgi:phosphoribosyl 1,2-cyclic phosphodiesterase